MDDKSKEIATLIDKAAAATNSGDAVQWAQAALNCATAVSALIYANPKKENN